MATGSEVLTDIVAMLTGMPRFHIGQWVGFSCPLGLQKTLAVMAGVDTEGGVYDSPLTGEAPSRADSSPD